MSGTPSSPSLIPGLLLLPVPLSSARWDCSRGCCSVVGVGASTRRAPTVRRNASAEKRKVSADEVQKLVRGHTKVPLMVDFYATWCGPFVQMAQDIDMLAVEYEDNTLFVKVDTDGEYEFAKDMQIIDKLKHGFVAYLRPKH